jgi:hypothetical protein
MDWDGGGEVLLLWDAPLLIMLNKGLEMEYLGHGQERDARGAGESWTRERTGKSRESAGARARGFGAAAMEQRIRREADGNYWSLPNAN